MVALVTRDGYLDLKGKMKESLSDEVSQEGSLLQSLQLLVLLLPYKPAVAMS